MGIFTSLGKGLDGLLTRRKAFQVQTDDSNRLYEQIYSMLGSGFAMPDYSIESAIKKGYVINPHIYTVINKKIKPASKVPFYLYEEKADKKKEIGRYKAALEKGNIEQAEFYLSKAYNLIEIKEINEVLNNPNENESFAEWLEATLGYYNLTGNAYTYGLHPDGFPDGYFSKLYTMPAQLTKIVTSNDWRKPVAGYSVDWFGLGAVPIPTDQVCHMKMWNPDTGNINRGLYGLSPLSPLCKVNQNSNDNFTAQMRLLQHGYPAGILSSDSERGLTPAQAKQQQADFDLRFGNENQKKVMLASHKVAWQALGLNSVDLQLLDADKASLATIARVYNVPTPLLLDDASTYNNIKEAGTSLWNNAILPDLARVRDDVFNKFYLPYWRKKTGKKLYIDYDLMSVEALKKDDKTTVEIIAMEIENGLLTPNQGREMRGREITADPLLDRYYLKHSLRPIDQPYTSANPKPPTNG